MFKTKKFYALLCCTMFVLLFYSMFGLNAYAEERQEIPPQKIEEADNYEITPYGLYTSLSIALNGGDGKVSATVRNEFTLFPATVYVIVQLYSSSDYCENYTQMTLESQNSILDLDMGDTITAEASTGGRQKYWLGRMRYKIDKKDWQEKIAGAGLYSSNGDLIGL